MTPFEIDADNPDPAGVATFREHGFVAVRGLLSPDEAAAFREQALDCTRTVGALSKGAVFSQYVNVWTAHEGMRALTLHPRLQKMATLLAGGPLRLWHDQILIKEPHNEAPTEFHQDQPYWPHANAVHPISAWIALQDTPVERGPMTFLSGSHRRTDLPAQRLDNPRSLFEVCPDLEWAPRTTIPLRAGDCTFHHGRCAHMATPNRTDLARVAHIVIFTDAETVYDGRGHVVTDPLGLKPGQLLDGPLFPLVDG